MAEACPEPQGTRLLRPRASRASHVSASKRLRTDARRGSPKPRRWRLTGCMLTLRVLLDHGRASFSSCSRFNMLHRNGVRYLPPAGEVTECARSSLRSDGARFWDTNGAGRAVPRPLFRHRWRFGLAATCRSCHVGAGAPHTRGVTTRARVSAEAIGRAGRSRRSRPRAVFGSATASCPCRSEFWARACSRSVEAHALSRGVRRPTVRGAPEAVLADSLADLST